MIERYIYYEYYHNHNYKCDNWKNYNCDVLEKIWMVKK
jgi:hypothetical protein